MGNPKQKWMPEEEEALRAGVAKHGTGKWKNIQKDPEFNKFLYSRSNIDLKDKWRNMSVSSANANGQGPREKSRTPKAKPNPDAPAAPLLLTYTSVSSTPAGLDASTDAAMDESSKVDAKTASTYNAMIYEALSTLKGPSGTDTSTILGFIEQRHEVPQNFRRILTTRLRRLVAQDKVEKLQKGYRIKQDVPPGGKIPSPKQKEIQQPRQPQIAPVRVDTLQDAARSAAYRIAEAENKAAIAAEAGKESERVLRMAEVAASMLQVANEIYEQCLRGDMVDLARI